MARKPTELRPVMVRLPETLRRLVERDADRNGRSMNTEIIHRLEKSFALEGDLRDQANSPRLKYDDTRKVVEILINYMNDKNSAMDEVQVLRQEMKDRVHELEEKVERELNQREVKQSPPPE